jgi:hypothetical protein
MRQVGGVAASPREAEALSDRQDPLAVGVGPHSEAAAVRRAGGALRAQWAVND